MTYKSGEKQMEFKVSKTFTFSCKRVKILINIRL